MNVATKIEYPEAVCGQVKTSPSFYWECCMPKDHEGDCYMVRDPYIDFRVRAHAR